ncbi:MAG: VOC family protein [Gammaproteobacteria bacterium]|nr:VOC family protein [Gammaproteobacteria bacterium]
MIGYTTVGTNDLARATAFYEQLFAPLGVKRAFENERVVSWTTGSGPSFGVIKPFDGRTATAGNGTMIALAVDKPATVDALHRKAIELGGRDEGPPGERFKGFYGAYFRDLDGNKLAVFCAG